jgi:hypothetical protein
MTRDSSAIAHRAAELLEPSYSHSFCVTDVIVIGRQYLVWDIQFAPSEVKKGN